MSDEFDFGTRIGMLFVVEASAASALAVTSLLLYIAYSAVAIKRNASRRWSTETHIHYYFLNLLICDLILSIGGLLNIKWIVEAHVYSNTLCTVQGVTKQVGDVGVALSTMAIALQMLQALAFRWESPPNFALVVLAIIWLIILLLVAVPNVVEHNIYGPTGYWCWIERETIQQIGLDYIWMWSAAALNVIAYVFLVFVIKRAYGGRGFRSLARERTYNGSGTESSSSTGPGREERIKAVQMFFYPLVYIVVVLPISAARFSAFRGHHVPFAVTAFADTVFASSGLFNTILFGLTRPRLLPRKRSRDARSVLPTRSPTNALSPYPWSPAGIINIDRNADGFSTMDLGRNGLHDYAPGLSPYSRSPL